ncbi:MAG TPA: hypothetical protein VGL53_05350 [Bryobacteraceae bacterium]
MPAILLLLIPILGEEGTVALFLSLCRFATIAMPYFAALTDNVGPAAPVERAAVSAGVIGMERYSFSGARSATGSLINEAYERAFQYWHPHVGGYQLTTQQLRAALKVVKDCKGSETRVEQLVRQAARTQRPAEFSAPMPSLVNLVRASECPILSNGNVASFLQRNSIVLRHSERGQGIQVFWRISLHHEHPLGELASIQERDPQILIQRISRLMTAGQVVVQ